jgi:xanthine dehydrogenase accessory factor
MSSVEFLSSLKDAMDNYSSVMVVTLVAVKGSGPAYPGARMIVGEGGRVWGTVGGGKVEVKAILQAMSYLQDMVLKQQTMQICEWNLQRDVGMTCGGQVTFLFELYRKQPLQHVAVFGAGHVAQSVVPLLLTARFGVSCFDSRQEWLDQLPNHPALQKTQTLNLAEQVAPLDESNFVVIMTMGHQTDLPILDAALKRKFPYIGNIGSLQKAKILKNDLKNLGHSQEQLNRFHCPIGVPLGARTPLEIAFSVVAQIIQQKNVLATSRAVIEERPQEPNP